MHASSATVTVVEAVRAFMVGFSSIWIDRRIDRTATDRGGAKRLQSGDTDPSAKRFQAPSPETRRSIAPQGITRRSAHFAPTKSGESPPRMARPAFGGECAFTLHRGTHYGLR